MMQSLDIKVWVDGGWGVDALLGKQTRKHKDLDIAVQKKDLKKLRKALQSRGYRDVPQDDTREWNFVLGDDGGRLVDIHVIEIDEAGNGIYGPVENGEMYPASSLTGEGVIEGVEVRCISVEDLVKFHSGYELSKTDYKDVKTLCEKFGVKLPGEYEGFEEK